MGARVTVSTEALTGGLDALQKRLRLLRARHAYVKAGVLGKAPVRTEGGITNAQLASVHEYGTSKVPARPFIAPPFHANRESYMQILQAGYRAAVTKDDPAVFVKMLRLLGMKIVADIRKHVTAGPPIPPPLSPKTIARKGSSRPLVDTGQMIRSIDYEVVE